MTKNMIKFSSKRLERESIQRGTMGIDPGEFYNQSQARMFHHFERLTGMDLSKDGTPDVYYNDFPKSRYTPTLWSDFSKMPGAILYDRKWYWLTNHPASCETIISAMCFVNFKSKQAALNSYYKQVNEAKAKPYTAVVDYVHLK